MTFRQWLPTLVGALVACGLPEVAQSPPEAARGKADSAEGLPHLRAVCSAKVSGHGWLRVETTYLPGVLACEHGEASEQALLAQAVAARTYLYYVHALKGGIKATIQDQHYGCGKRVRQRHIDAVEQTTGEILVYNGKPIAAFYVRGSRPDASSCVGTPVRELSRYQRINLFGWTEKYVTYNEGLEADEVDGSRIGDGTQANRGCMSQLGADCLAEQKASYEEILRFFYGEDAQLVVASGPCTDGVALSNKCADCNVSEDDCVFADDAYRCVPKSARCDYVDGTTFRQCKCNGWQFCLPDGTWSGACEPAPALFSCL
jgi:hypothetical protein